TYLSNILFPQHNSSFPPVFCHVLFINDKYTIGCTEFFTTSFTAWGYTRQLPCLRFNSPGGSHRLHFLCFGISCKSLIFVCFNPVQGNFPIAVTMNTKAVSFCQGRCSQAGLSL